MATESRQELRPRSVPRRRRRGWQSLLLAGVASLIAQAGAAAGTQDLRPLLNGANATISLDPSTVYTTTEVALTTTKTLLCNGASIQSTGGPIRISGAGQRLTVDNCVIQGTGWALLGALSGGDLVVRNNTRLTGNAANSGIYVKGATLDLRASSISGCRWGVNMENADALIDGTTITGTEYGVQNVAGTATIQNGSRLENTNAARPGVGLSLIASSSYPARRAAGVVHDSVFVGFLNAIDIQPSAAQGLLPGTLEVVNCRFDDAFSSALSSVDAVDLRFADSQVNRARTDGIYLVNTSGVIEHTQVIGSLNTGVTFLGCESGAVLRNSLVSGSAHQGVSVAADPATGRLSRYVQIVDNTLRGNQIANVLVDAYSDVLLQGNLMSGAPDFSLRLTGSPNPRLIGDLVFDSSRGLEMKDGEATVALSLFTGHDHDGALVYNDAIASIAFSALRDNLRANVASDYSLFANLGGVVGVRRSLFGPSDSRALYNNAGTTLAAARNFWSSSAGPKLPGSSSGGARIGWNTANGSAVTSSPFLGAAPLDTNINRTFVLAANATATWPAFADLTLSLTGAAGIPTTSQVVAALRVRDTAMVTTPVPLGGTLADGLFVVWADYDLLSRASAGGLRVRTTGPGATAGLFRLQPDGSWLRLPTTWDAGTAQVVYDAADPTTLNGVFALVDLPPERQTRARQLITAYYTDILGRGPEAGAVDAWYNGYFLATVSSSIDVGFVFQEMGRLFFASQEYANRNRSNAQFITDCYQVFLRRQPSTAELNAWLADPSWNRPQVVAQFAASTEFANYVHGQFPGLAGVPSRNVITVMYIGLLDRLVDSAGLGYFAGQFEWAYAAGGIEAVRAQARSLGRQTLASAEYRSKNPTNSTHVQRLYRGYLGRFPSTSELNYWTNELTAGRQTTDSLVDAFAASTEFTTFLNASFGQL